MYSVYMDFMYICNTHSSGHAATFGYCRSRRLLAHTHAHSLLNAHTHTHTYPASSSTGGLLLLFSTLHAARASFVCFTHSAFPHTTRCAQVPVWLLLTVRFFVSCLFALSQFACFFFILHTLTHKLTSTSRCGRTMRRRRTLHSAALKKRTHTHSNHNWVVLQTLAYV